MELTFENFIAFCESHAYYIKDRVITQDTLVTDIANQGDDVIEFLQTLDNTFNVTFKNFEFSKYFLSEGELIDRINLFKILFNRKSIREVDETFTLGQLYDS